MKTYLTTVRKALIGFLLAAAPLAAQTGLGAVNGRVQDPSKGSVPGAAVSLTDVARGIVHTAKSNDSGLYYFESLQIGQYHLNVQAPGFETWETDFKVDAGQTLTIDPALLMGRVEVKVDVSGAAPLIQTEGAQLSDDKTAAEIHDLPLNGRQITNLFTLTAGVEGGQNQATATTPLTPRTNGMMTGSTEILLDGQSYRDTYGGGMSRVQPGLDSIQEYRVETAGSGASVDNPAAIELVTRSGTNAFHGGAYETLRDNYGGLVARQVQDHTSAPPKYIRNEFGGFVGGPIKKDKTFFFYDQELMKLRQEVTANTSVPTAANWAGDFSNKVDNNGDPFTIYNPFTTNSAGVRAPFPGNKIPSSLIDTQLVNALEAITPKPSPGYENVNPFLASNFYTTYPLSTNTDSITARGDQVFSERDTLSLRMTRSTYDFLQDGGHYGYPAPGVSNATGTSAQDSNIYNTTAHYSHTFSPTLLNDLQLGAMISRNHQGTNSDAVPWDSTLGLPNPFGATGWPTLSLGEYNFNTAYDPFEGGAWDNDNPKYQNLTQYQAEDHVSWVRGKHTLKFGFRFLSEFNNVTETQQEQGSNTFDLAWTGLWSPSTQSITPYTGSDLASLELGIPDYLSNQYNHGFFYFRQQEYAGFGEDTWRLTPNLTLSAGLRWEFWTPYHEKYNRIENLNLNEVLSDPTSMQVIFPGNTNINNPAIAPAAVIQSWEARGLTGVSANSVNFPSALIPNVWTDFAPRVALAYSPFKNWVIRGGYGMYYFPMPLSQLLHSMRVNPPLNLRYVNNVGQNNVGNINYSLLDNPNSTQLLSGVGGTASVSATSAPSGPQPFLAMDTNNWNDNRMQEWTFAIEHELPANMVLRLAYTGNHGSNLEQSWDFNAPLSQYNYQLLNGIQPSQSAILGTPALRQVNPNWSMTGLTGVLEHNGYSNNTSFQISLNKRLSHGLAFSWFYTYTHAMDTDDPDGYSTVGGSINSISDGGSISASVPENGEIMGDPQLSPSQRLRLLYTNSGQIPPQRMTWSGLWQLPVGRNQRFLSNSNRLVDAVAGGWQIAFIGTWEGGFWMGNSSNLYQFGIPNLNSSQRLNLNFGGDNQLLWFAGYFNPLLASNVNLSQLEALVPLNPTSRTIHPVGADLGDDVPLTVNGVSTNVTLNDMLSPNRRNYMLGPGSWNQDVTLFKYFGITERVRLRMSGDFFNAFNHPNLNNPNSSTGLIDLSTQPNAARIIQLGARLEF